MEVPARILIIDDDESSDHSLVSVLTRAGFDCCGVSTEGAAVADLAPGPDAASVPYLVRPFTTDEILATIYDALHARFEHPVHHRRGPDLTRREVEVLGLIAAGLPNKAIADRLFVSLHTARNHVKSILHKLGAHSRLEAVAIAVHGGFIERDFTEGTGLADRLPYSLPTDVHLQGPGIPELTAI
jgi:DNA-binding NarL/FixJ family response regulator